MISARLRLSVFRSHRHIYAQIIDDRQGKTLASAHDREIIDQTSLTPIQKASLVGEMIAKKALKRKITHIAFDRGPYRFHGQIKALAQAVRSKGLQF